MSYVSDGSATLEMPILLINHLGNVALLRMKEKGNMDSVDINYLSGIFGYPVGDNDILFLGGDKLRKDQYTAFKRVL